MKNIFIICLSLICFNTKLMGQCPSLAGEIIGDEDVCTSINSGELFLINNTGVVLDWETAPASIGPWSSLGLTDSSYIFNNVTDTVYYRVIVLENTCINDTTDVFQVDVHPLPIVGFTADTVCFKESTEFLNTSTLSNGTINSVQWNFGDGNDDNDFDIDYLYETANIYSVLLEVTTNKGCIDSIRENAVVRALPAPNFIFDTVCATIVVSFDNTSTITSSAENGSIDNYFWDFNDGIGDQVVTNDTIYQFSVGDLYEVELTAVSSFGCSDSIIKEVLVYNKPIVDIAVDTSCFSYNAVVMNATLNSEIDTFYWRWGDGQTSTIWNPTHQYGSTGDFTAELLITTTNSCVNQGSSITYVKPTPVANYDVIGSCVYDSVLFQNNSTFSIGTMTYLWSFGIDNSTLVSPKVKYDSAFTYFSNLEVLGDNGCKAVSNKPVFIQSTASAAFSVGNTCVAQDLQIQNLTTKVDSFTSIWDFGDGNLSNEQNPMFSFTSVGLHTIQLIATTDLGCPDTVQSIIEVKPIGYPSFSTNLSCDGLPTQFSDSTILLSGNIVSYLWNFGDGDLNVAQSPIHQYLNPGLYNVKLEVVTDLGCVNDTIVEVEVNEFPVPNFNNADVCVGDVVNFGNSTSVPNGVVSYLWSFGDGNTSTVQYPIHYYSESGTFIAKLIATSNAGCTDSISRIVNIFRAPYVNVGLDTIINLGEEITLSATVGNAVVYAWSPELEVSSTSSDSPLVSPEIDTEFILNIVDIFGCVNSDTILVKVDREYQFIINNVVTPNFNDENDTWIITNIESFPDSHVKIYDRWGRNIFEMDGYDNSWSGTNGKDELPDGTYYYTLSFDSITAVYNGAITLLRDN